MPTQTKELLKRIRNFHNKLNRFYADLGSVTKDEKVKLLLTYLKSHESNMEKELMQYSQEADKKVLDSWFTYTLDDRKWQFLDMMCVDEDMTVDDVMDTVLKADQYLQDLYGGLTRIADNREAKAIFETLHKNGERERRKIVQMATSDF